MYRHSWSLERTILTNFAQISMQFDTDIHGLQRINPNDFGDPVVFHLVPSFFHDQTSINISAIQSTVVVFTTTLCIVLTCRNQHPKISCDNCKNYLISMLSVLAWLCAFNYFWIIVFIKCYQIVKNSNHKCPENNETSIFNL